MVSNFDNFITKAKEKYNNKYDYSKVQYVNRSTPVTIICPEHGEYIRTPGYHLRGGDCPVCAKARQLAGCRKPMSAEAKEKRRQTNLKKYGATTFAGSKQAKDLYEKGRGPWSKNARTKAARTCEERFGAKTWAESDIGIAIAKKNCEDENVRKQMSERAKSNIARQHYSETTQKHYGSNHWTQSEQGKQKLHDMFSTDEERKARSDRMKSIEVQSKIRATSIERYGVPYYWQSDDGKKRLKVLLNNKAVQDKIIATKKLRGTLNSSKPERIVHQMLVDKFGEDDIESQYHTDKRYPFACDFYIKSLDLFIELNLSWLHGFHWFDENNEADVRRLKEMSEKADGGKPLYKRAIYIWTFDDLRKREIAIKNNLNYLVFWNNNLCDFKKWYESI